MFTRVRTMSALLKRTLSYSRSYEDAIEILNGLQSNTSYLKEFKENESKNLSCKRTKCLEQSIKYLIRSGLTVEQLDDLSVIHVSGTKGKGSTCAFTEAILREHGFRTGFYSSPHLISVNERIRINGQPVNKIEFTREFWHVYDILEQRRETETDMPMYFQFLTLLMFHIFIKSNIDVAIIEVGIGGELDCTNVVNRPICTGMSSLGLDHETILGNSLEAIAFQKSGIFKPGVPAYTVEQPNLAMNVLMNRAYEKNCILSIAPPLDSYPWRSTPTLGICSSVQLNNASLAIQLSSTWMKKYAENSRYDKEPCKRTNLCFDKVSCALASCKWPGRTQIVLGKTIDFYVDGAHTQESIECCSIWFQDSILSARKGRKRYLIFNATNNRDVNKLLVPLKKLKFSTAFFVPNTIGLSERLDHVNVSNPIGMQLEKCWNFATEWGDNSIVANSVYEALEIIRKEANPLKSNNCKPQVLVTGSLHLVGALLSIIDPELSMKSNF